ncbi:hypothetical protein [Pseudoroseicyclus tamaricis]|nr:hypothetical protein [Pseudoroseicyclus tamaricis]
MAALALWAVAVALVVLGLVTGQTVMWIGSAGAIALALLLPLYTRVSGIEMPPGLATGVLVFSLCAFVLGEHAGAYTTLGWWDIVLHLLASAVLALVGLALVLLNTEGAPPRTGLWIGAVLGVGFAALVGGAWELLEFSIDAIFGTNAQRSGLPDTMGDVLTNLAGATYGAVAGRLVLRRGLRLPLSGLLVAFCARNPVIYGAWPGVPFQKAGRQPAATTEAPLMETT